MNAKQKIERLTSGWYGYAVFATGLSIVGLLGSGMVSMAVGLVFNAVGLVLSLALTAFLGRKLVRKSSGTRKLLVVLSAVVCVFGVLATVGAAWDMLQERSIASLCTVVIMASCTMLNGRSFRVLRETSVRAYFV
jgi:predicted RND superfamily exporter protein